MQTYLIQTLPATGTLIRKWRPEAIIKPELFFFFYARFDEEWKSVGKCDRTKGVTWI